MEQATFKSILDRVGVKFLKYILNYQGEIEYQSQINDIDFNEKQISVLEEFNTVLAQIAYARFPGPSEEFHHFLFGLKLGDESLFNIYRHQCHGIIYEIIETESIVGFLSKKTVELYPSLLLRAHISFNPFHTDKTSYFPKTKKEIGEFKELLLKDTELSKLVSIWGDESFAYQFGYILDNGAVNITFGDDVVKSIIVRAFYNCCFRMKYEIGDVINEVKSNVEKLRKIASEQEIEFSTFLGIYGLRLAEVEEFQLSENCILRKIDSLHNPIQKINRTTSITSTDISSCIIIGCILELKQKVKGKALPSDFKSSSFHNDEISKTIQNLKYSLVFSLNQSYAPMKETFIDVDLPMFSLYPYFHDDRSAGGSVMTNTQLRELKEWFNLINSIELNYVKVPLKRLQYAIFGRKDPEDSILDAFIAWEGMFSESFETTFQVTGTIAKFLEDDEIKRRDLLKRLKDLYGFRSHLAHGNPEEHKLLKKENMTDLQKEIIGIGIQCLKKLLKDKELLKLKPKERINKLLLGVSKE